MTAAELLTPAFTPVRLRAPAPPVPPRDLSFFALVRQMRANSLGAWPARAYDELVLHRRLLGTDCYLVNDPEEIQRILLDNDGAYERPVSIRRLLRPGVGKGLLLAEGESWRSQRRLVAPHFGPRRMEEMAERLDAVAHAAVDALDPAAPVDLANAFELAALDGLDAAVFSGAIRSRASSFADLVRHYFRAAARLSLWDFVARREGRGVGRGRALGQRWFALIEAVIAERRRSGGGNGDLLDALLAARDPLTGAPPDAAGVRDEIASVLAAGFDSTGRALFWSAYLLARDPAAQDRVAEELRRAPPGGPNAGSRPFLDAVIKEAMRLYPPLATIVRSARQADSIAGIPVRKGALVIVSPWVLHRHRRFWREPELFLPERFLGHSGFHDRAYLPFGVGRRTCLGAALSWSEIRTVLAHLLARYRISLASAGPVLPTATITTAPDPVPLFHLTPRERPHL